MNKTVLKSTSAGAALVGWMVLSAFSPAAKSIEIGVPATSAAAWEIAAMQEAGIGEHYGIAVEIADMADAAAGQAALLGRDVDLILTDFLWASAQRDGGKDYVFVPQSHAAGALLVAAGGPVQSVADLAGATLAVAGGPEDPAFAVLRAYAAAQTGAPLPEPRFDTAAAVTDLLLAGEVGAALGAGDDLARAMAEGATALVTVDAMIGALGVDPPPPMFGWVFSERWARSHRDEVARFLDASFETRQRLMEDDALWDSIRPAMGEGLSDAAFAALRDGYRQAMVTTLDPADADAAARLQAAIAPEGAGLAEGTFWDGYGIGG